MASVVGGGLAGQKNKSKTGKVESGEKYYGKAIVGGFLTMLFFSLLAQAAPAPAAYMSMGTAGYGFFHYGLPAINKRYPKGKTNERLPFTPGPTITPEPLGEILV